MNDTPKGKRPVAGSQRPTGGDKAIVTSRRQFFRRRKVCKFCVDRIDFIDYKDTRLLSQFVSERGKIVPRRISGVCNPCQRRLSEAIKQARNIALLPYIGPVPGATPRPDRSERGWGRSQERSAESAPAPAAPAEAPAAPAAAE